jgi:hypothetical protein
LVLENGWFYKIHSRNTLSPIPEPRERHSSYNS